MNMKYNRSILGAAINGLFNAEPEGVSQTGKAMEAAENPQDNAKKALDAKLAPFIGMGKQVAESIIKATRDADTVAKADLLEAAKKLSGKEIEQEAFLTGYAEAFKAEKMPDTTVKVRKSEAKAVLLAWSAPKAADVDEARKRLETAAAERGAGNSYNDFIRLCREVRDGTEPGKRQGTNQPGEVRSLSDARHGKVIEAIKGMTMAQALTAGNGIVQQVMASHPGKVAADLALMRWCVNIVLAPLTRSTDNGIAQAAKAASDRFTAILTEADKAAGKPTVGAPEVQPAEGTSAPQPAEAAIEQHTGTNG